MVDRLRKNLAKLSAKDQERVFIVVGKIVNNDLNGLDVKPLKGVENGFRVRVGDFRIIFTRNRSGRNVIITFERRNEGTYRGF